MRQKDKKYTGFTPLEKAANLFGTRHKSKVRGTDYTQPFSIIRRQGSLTGFTPLEKTDDLITGQKSMADGNSFKRAFSCIAGQRFLTGFTLAELLMAVWIIGIILAAVATLSFAFGSANDSLDNSSQVQSRIRYTTMRINELVRNSKLICRNASSNVVLWLSDYNGDNKINPGEIASFETGTDGNCINLVSFHPNASQAGLALTLATIRTGLYKSWMATRSIPSSSVTLINNCSYIYFTNDTPPPFAKKLNIFFKVSQSDISRDYQIAAAMRCNTDYMLSANGQSLLNSDDDM